MAKIGNTSCPVLVAPRVALKQHRLHLVLPGIQGESTAPTKKDGQGQYTRREKGRKGVGLPVESGSVPGQPHQADRGMFILSRVIGIVGALETQRDGGRLDCMQKYKNMKVATLRRW